MNTELALNLLSRIMQWDDARSREEFLWLSLMARLKYDGYRDYAAGMRFLEALASWLQQFAQNDREAAYHFVRTRLAFLSATEIQQLIRLFYSENVRPRLQRAVSEQLQIPFHETLARPEAKEALRKLRRRSLFLGLSDGARLDSFRRANSGRITNEQIVPVIEPAEAKWNALRDDLRHHLTDDDATFSFVFLVDDFVGSGKTLLRKEKTKWSGRLSKFLKQLREHTPEIIDPDAVVIAHHYVASAAAVKNIAESVQEADADPNWQWFRRLELSYGFVLPETFPLTPELDTAFWKLTDRYYDASIESKAMKVGGSDARRGFGGGALPLVLEHNTPNNTVALLWAETDGDAGAHPIRPLFRRRQRHTDDQIGVDL